MKKITTCYFALFFIQSLPGFCQDLIATLSGEIIEAKVEIIDKKTIKYKVYSNQNGPFYVIDKNDVQLLNSKMVR